MSNYTKTTNFASKDNLSPGNPLKIVKGTEIDTEFNNIQTAVGTKTDNASANITGGSITGITDLAVADGGTGASTATAALNNLLPSQTSNANKYLQTDGTNASWDAISISTGDITGTLPVANGGTGVTSSTGTGSVVLSNSPTLVTPALGTPASGVATNLTGLPLSSGVTGTLPVANGGTGITSLGTGVATFLGTPSSANLASAVTDETGSGALVFANSPTLVTPALGTPSALVGTNITGTASGLTAGTVTTNANLTGAVTSVGNATSLGSFSSANLLGALTDETGTGSAVFATSPTLVTPILGTPTSATLTNATGLPLSTGVTGQLPVANGGTGTATPSLVAGTNVTITGTWPNQTIDASGGGGSGTVTSVAASVPSVFSITGSPITTSGTLAITYSGTALPVANGGTGQTALSAVTVGTSTNIAGGSNGTIPYQSASGTTQMLAVGTAGQVLQTNGVGAPTWATVSAGNFGTDLSFVDYPLTTSTQLSTINQQIKMQAVDLDGTSRLMILHSDASAHAVVYNASTDTFGTPVLVRTASLPAINNIALAKISTTQVLVCSLENSTTALESVVLTVSGSTITVGTALATTLSATSQLIPSNTRLVTVGSSYVLNFTYDSPPTPRFLAITVSGSTPSVGSEFSYPNGNSATYNHSYAHSSSILLSFSASATVLYAYPISVSGTTLTGGTEATTTVSNNQFVTGALNTGRYAVLFRNTSGRSGLVSIAGTTASISLAATTLNILTYNPQMQVFGNRAYILGGTGATDQISIATDTAGTITVGTPIDAPFAGSFVGYLSSEKMLFASQTANNSLYALIGSSSGAAVTEKILQNIVSSSFPMAINNSRYRSPLSGLPQSAGGNSISMRTSSGKTCIASTNAPFLVSIDGVYPGKIQQTISAYAFWNDPISQAITWGTPDAQGGTSSAILIRKQTLS